jgi:hypothetical protein
MKLHENIKLFSDTLRAASQHLGDFVETFFYIKRKTSYRI